MKNQGWIKLHRQILENPICEKPNYLAVWIYLLAKANHSDKYVIWNNKKTLIKKGSFIGSISKISKQFKLSTGTVSNILNYLISEKMIEKHSTRKFTLFTILNWEVYQSEVEKKTENNLKTTCRQLETNKNVKNVKNDKKYICSFNKFWEMYPRKVGKKKAETIYNRKASSPLKEKNILEGLKGYIKKWATENTLKDYIPHPSTWLSQERWNDEVEVSRKAENENFRMFEKKMQEKKASTQKAYVQDEVTGEMVSLSEDMKEYADTLK